VECKSDADCTDAQYCQRPAEDCSAPTGTCTDRPEVCADLYQPVCGCDGVTYGNECRMQAAGASLRSDGTCDGGR
jgi:hypothetical protein